MATQTIPQTTFGIRLFMARRHAGLQQSELGAKLDPPVSGGAIGFWERDAGSPKHYEETMRQLAEILEVDLAWLALGLTPQGVTVGYTENAGHSHRQRSLWDPTEPGISPAASGASRRFPELAA